MKVLLVNPPNGFLDPTDLAPPLGLLTLAGVLRGVNHEVHVRDFNLEVMANRITGGEGFYESAIDIITEIGPDVVGFTSMCMESHVSLELARRVKAIQPDITTVFGGTHFGAIAQQLLKHFPFTDFAVAGEGEDAIVAILNYLERKKGSLPENVWYREGGAVRRGTQTAYKFALEAMPFPGYDLVQLERYFDLNPRRVLDYDGGRGCVYKCSFCYSPFQYGDAVRSKNPRVIVRDLRRLSELGAKHVFFVQDNFLNSTKWAVDVCRQIADAQLPLSWSCYATYPQLSKEIIDLMASSRCTGLFTGIDAVSPAYQLRMNKRFLQDWRSVHEKLTYCVEQGVIPTCAFILEKADQDRQEREATIRTAIECLEIGCEVHVNTLSIYNGSKLDQLSMISGPTYSAAKVDLLMDTPAVVRENECAKVWPSLFPYHSTYSNPQQWQIFIARVHTLFALLYAFPKSLHQYVVEEGNSVWDRTEHIDRQFVIWLEALAPQKRRLAAIERFWECFPASTLSPNTLDLFRKELARLALSQCRANRVVKLVVKDKTKTYNLSWFIDLSGDDKKSSSKAGGMIPSLLKNFPAPKTFHLRDYPDKCEFALLSRRKTVRIRSLTTEFAIALSNCEEAAASGQPFSISQETADQLERDGWIWQ